MDPKKQLLGAFDEAVQHFVHAAAAVSSSSPASTRRTEFEVRACIEELLRTYEQSMHEQHTKALQAAEEHRLRMERLRRKRTALQAVPLEGKENMAPSKAKGIGSGDGALEKALANRQQVVETRERQIAELLSRHETRAEELAALEARMSNPSHLQTRALAEVQELAAVAKQRFQHDEASERELSNQRIASEERAFASIAKAIADREFQAAVAETRVGERERAVSAAEDGVALREKQMSHATTAASGSEQEIKGQLLAAEQRVQDIECEVAAKQNSLDAVERDFRARNQEITGTLSTGRAELRQQEERVARRNEELEVHEQALLVRERALGDREAALIGRERNVAEREQSQKDAWLRLQERLTDQEREQSRARQALEHVRLDVIKRQYGLGEQLSSMETAEQNLARERASLANELREGKHSIEQEEARSTTLRQLEDERARLAAQASILAARAASLQSRDQAQRLEMESLATQVRELASLEEALVSKDVGQRQAEQRVLLKQEHLAGWERRIQDQEHELAVGLVEVRRGLARAEDVRAWERAICDREREQASMDQRLIEREEQVAAREEQPALRKPEPTCLPQAKDPRDQNIEDGVRRKRLTARKQAARNPCIAARGRHSAGAVLFHAPTLEGGTSVSLDAWGFPPASATDRT